MPDEEISRQLLTTGARRLADAARQKMNGSGAAYLGVNHWLLALLERHAAMAEAMAVNFQFQAVQSQVLLEVQQGSAGSELDEKRVILEAVSRARLRDRTQATERDLAAVILAAAGFELSRGFEGPHVVIANGEAAAVQSSPQPVQPFTPNLDLFGRDLSQAARAGKISSVVGREEETDLVLETLCRRTKRNPVLVGPAGVGKTAIVEGLAVRVIEDKVPDILKNARIIALQPSTMLAGASMSGELEKRMKAILQEASQEGILLFIDEIHTIMGAGGMVGTTDLGSMLKPALARGDIACIAATTDDEYRRFIESDSALERRFQPIRIQELSPAQTLAVLQSLRDELQTANKVTVSDEILRWLIDFGHQFMRNRYFPDKAVDLLEQCFAHAVANGKDRVELSDAKQVAQRMVGMPVVSYERISSLEQALKARRLLTDEEIQILTNRLQVTMRGLDMRTSRPNAILMLSGSAADNGQVLSEAIAEELFSSGDRVITVDCSRFNQPEDVNLLLGAPPGYVGYSERLPLHRLLQIPWCVLHLERVDSCHPRIREILAQGFMDGWLMDGRGKTIYLSDAIVVMTAEISLQTHRSLGFNPEQKHLTPDDLFSAISAQVGDALAEQVDLYVFGQAETEGVSLEWLKDHFLMDLCDRYMKQGIDLVWDDSFMTWLAREEVTQLSEHDWENWVDRFLAPAIIPYLMNLKDGQPVKVRVRVEGDSIKVVEA